MSIIFTQVAELSDGLRNPKYALKDEYKDMANPLFYHIDQRLRHTAMEKKRKAGDFKPIRRMCKFTKAFGKLPSLLRSRIFGVVAHRVLRDRVEESEWSTDVGVAAVLSLLALAVQDCEDDADAQKDLVNALTHIDYPVIPCLSILAFEMESDFKQEAMWILSKLSSFEVEGDDIGGSSNVLGNARAKVAEEERRKNKERVKAARARVMANMARLRESSSKAHGIDDMEVEDDAYGNQAPKPMALMTWKRRTTLTGIKLQSPWH